ncbi:XkdX family protein [Bacillus subtilis]|uniref:XkdX family protein n=1 Tax=Bacillus subtilis TaxID=1423 RepID=UPI002557BDDF|nr:XkdX family protein [Bacillus subtilis]MDL2028249.1 XkdX family protein [Bacillus subtilis]
MDWFTNIQTIYGWGRQYYTNADVARFVELNRITEKQYKQITGLTYPATKPVISVDLGL